MTSKLTRLTDQELAELAFYAGESTCHPDPNYLLGFESLTTGSSVLSIVTELQERRKAERDSDPVAFTEEHEISNMHATGLYIRAWPADRARNAVEGYTIPLYRHAQPVPVGSEFIPKNLDRALGVLGMALPESKEEFNLQSERWIQRLIDRVIRYADEFKEQPALATQQEPIAWLNDAYLARGVVDGEAGSEDAGPGYIPVYREASPVVQDTRAITQYFDTIALETARGIMCDVNRRGDFLGGDTQLLSRIQCRVDEACRAAMLQAGNPTEWWSGLYNEIKGRGRTSPGDFTPDLGMSTEDILDAINNRNISDAGNSPVIPDGSEQRIAEAVELLKGAAPAMLSDDSGPNGPLVGRLKAQAVPGWIPVSERMPPSRHEVLVGRWWGEKTRWCSKWGTYIPGHPDAQSSGWLIPGGSWVPTHWQELPSAPQEAK